MPDFAALRALRGDLAEPDHYPTCPICGNLCGRLARVCVDCGARLYEPGAEPVDAEHRAHIESHAVSERDPAPPEGKVS